MITQVGIKVLRHVKIWLMNYVQVIEKRYFKYSGINTLLASLRSPLGDSGIIENLAGLLNEASGKQLEFQIQALRVLGNLCFDHGNLIYITIAIVTN